MCDMRRLVTQGMYSQADLLYERSRVMLEKVDPESLHVPVSLIFQAHLLDCQVGAMGQHVSSVGCRAVITNDKSKPERT